MSVPSGPVQLPLAFDVRPALGRDDFLVSDCNADAVRLIDAQDTWQDPVLVLAGPSGSGKTHLAHVFAAATEAEILSYASVTDDVIDRVATTAGCLVVEAADTSGDERLLFHVINATRQSGGRLLITGQTPPKLWPVGLPDLKSRLMAAPLATIEPPDDAMMEAIIVKLFADRQVGVAPDAVSYVMKRMPRSYAAVRRLVVRADALALAKHRALTVPLMREVLDKPDIWDGLTETEV